MKKDPIDRLFEEKLKDHSEVPDPKVWKAIESSLDKKKKSKKAIPPWWKYAGAAAVLLLALYLLNPAGEQDIQPDPVTDTGGGAPELRGNKEVPADVQEVTPAVETPVTATPGNGQTETPQHFNHAQDGTKAGETEIASESPENTGSNVVDRTDKPAKAAAQRTGQPFQGAMEVAGTGKDAGEKPIVVNAGDGAPADDNTNMPQEDAIAAGVAAGQERREMQPGKDRDNPNAPAKEEIQAVGEQPQKKSIYDEIAEMQSPEAEDSNHPHWSVGPRVAPVYFNSFGQGSPIHSSFVANSKSGNINLSYGIALSYAITPKLSVRSGINKVDYGYDTNDISFTPALAVSSNEKIDNIDYSLTARNLIVRNSSEARAAQNILAEEVAAPNPERDGRMVQQFGYVEVPLELNYALVDNRLGIHLIGGLSSLFLVDNAVTLESNGNSTEMGAANNLNSLNFSTNFGVGIQYDLTDKWQLNLEPVFKYQLNTFSDAAGNFNPYSIGIYSGLSIKF